jgi:arginyl-tRNA--protein-N-Asp/Glu arginylyltransferase
MYKASRAPESLSPQQLDDYLERGWYRMHQTIFTTQFLQEKFTFRDAIWLRQNLKEFEFPKWFTKLQRNKYFKVEITDAHPTPEHELLYQAYRQNKPEGWPDSLENILYGESSHNIYNTKMINLYSGNILVGAGFFDIGEKAASGIVNYYDPVFSKYRIGKYLFLLAIEYCQKLEMNYFYPGYFAPGNKHFDYKLDVHQPSLEFYEVASNRWILFRFFDPENLPLNIMEKKLLALIPELEHKGIPSCLIHNANFSFITNSRWDSPLATYILPTDANSRQYAVTYDTNTEAYYIFDCTDMEFADLIIEEDNKLICLQFLNLKHPVASSSSIEELAEKIIDLKLIENENK